MDRDNDISMFYILEWRASLCNPQFHAVMLCFQT